MNKNKLKTALPIAHDLQRRYTALRAASTQNVRNPLPMWKLVIDALPVLPQKYEQVKVRLSVKGQKFIRSLPAHLVFDETYWEKHSFTVEDVVSKIQSAGFIAKRNTVAMTLNHLLRSRMAVSIRCVRPLPKQAYRKNTSYCRYHLLAS